jgi:hypothetical protein
MVAARSLTGSCYPPAMARRAPTAPLSPKLLQHFAVATAAITACIALFADGQGENVVGHAVAAQQTEAEQAVASAGARLKPANALTTKIRDARTTIIPVLVDSDSDAGGDGRPMDTAGGSGSGSSGGGGGYAPLPTRPATAPAAPPPPGMPLASQPARREINARRPPTREEIERLEEASRNRSGGGEPD